MAMMVKVLSTHLAEWKGSSNFAAKSKQCLLKEPNTKTENALAIVTFKSSIAQQLPVTSTLFEPK